MAMSDKTTSPSLLPTVTVLGAGAMGAAMAERLVEQGFRVGVWNRSFGPAARLAEHGVQAYARSDEAAADADVVLTMLPTAGAVSEVMLERGVVDAMRPGAVWAQMGTIGVEATEALRSQMSERRP